MPAGLRALGDDEVDAGGLLALGVDDRADEAGDEDAALVGLGDEVVGGRAEGVGDELDLGVGPDDVEQRPARSGARTPSARRRARISTPFVVPYGQRLDAVAGEQVLDELAVLVGDQLVDLLGAVSPPSSIPMYFAGTMMSTP